MQRHTLAALVIAALAAAAAQPALAAPQTTIRHADLDLAKPADVAVMLKRIRHAAVDVCQAGDPASTSNDIAATERFETCYRQSIVRAVGSLNASLVTAAADRQGFAVQPALLAQNATK